MSFNLSIMWVVNQIVLPLIEDLWLRILLAYLCTAAILESIWSTWDRCLEPCAKSCMWTPRSVCGLCPNWTFWDMSYLKTASELTKRRSKRSKSGHLLDTFVMSGASSTLHHFSGASSRTFHPLSPPSLTAWSKGSLFGYSMPRRASTNWRS